MSKGLKKEIEAEATFTVVVPLSADNEKDLRGTVLHAFNRIRLGVRDDHHLKNARVHTQAELVAEGNYKFDDPDPEVLDMNPETLAQDILYWWQNSKDHEEMPAPLFVRLQAQAHGEDVSEVWEQYQKEDEEE